MLCKLQGSNKRKSAEVIPKHTYPVAKKLNKQEKAIADARREVSFNHNFEYYRIGKIQHTNICSRWCDEILSPCGDILKLNRAVYISYILKFPLIFIN